MKNTILWFLWFLRFCASLVTNEWWSFLLHKPNSKLFLIRNEPSQIILYYILSSIPLSHVNIKTLQISCCGFQLFPFLSDFNLDLLRILFILLACFFVSLFDPKTLPLYACALVHYKPELQNEVYVIGVLDQNRMGLVRILGGPLHQRVLRQLLSICCCNVLEVGY